MSNDRARKPPRPAAVGMPAPEDLDPPAQGRDRSGRVQFDDRGNAVWEWSVSTGAFGREVSTERLKKLESGLSLADDAPTPFRDRVKPNPQGVVKGYNPYDSGSLESGKPAEVPRKKDLRKLGEWLKLKKQAARNKDEE